MVGTTTRDQCRFIILSFCYHKDFQDSHSLQRRHLETVDRKKEDEGKVCGVNVEVFLCTVWGLGCICGGKCIARANSFVLVAARCPFQVSECAG